MKAIAIEAFGGRDKLRLMELPKPKPGPQEVLIQIKAAGVNPVVVKVREGLLQKRIPHEFPLILGWNAAGVVEAVGEGVSSHGASLWLLFAAAGLLFASMAALPSMWLPFARV